MDGTGAPPQHSLRDELRHLVWARTPDRHWEASLHGYRLLVRPPDLYARMRDYRCIDYAGNDNVIVAEAWAQGRFRKPDVPPDVRVRVVGKVEFFAHVGRGKGHRFHYRSDDPLSPMPDSVLARVRAPDSGIRWRQRNAFKAIVEGDPRPLRASFTTGLYALLAEALDRHRGAHLTPEGWLRPQA